MKNTRIRRFCAGAGLVMLLMTAGMVDPKPAMLLGWLAVSAALLYTGKAFTFQQQQNKEERA